jgi:hypothetical protein
MDLMMMERVGDRWEKMEGSCSTGQSPQRAVVQVEEEEDKNLFSFFLLELRTAKHFKLSFCRHVSHKRIQYSI